MLDDLRLAEPENLPKELLNGKFDLTWLQKVLADLIDAETELQHKQAIRQLGGGLEEIYTNWQATSKIMSLIEAYIDFPDEDTC